MGDVQFDEPQYGSRSLAVGKPSLIAGLVIRLGLARNNVGAQKVLLITLAVLVLVAIGWSMLPGGEVPAPPTPADPTWPR